MDFAQTAILAGGDQKGSCFFLLRFLQDRPWWGFVWVSSYAWRTDVSSEPGFQKKDGGRWWQGTHSSHKAGVGGWAVMREVGSSGVDMSLRSPGKPCAARERPLALVCSHVLGRDLDIATLTLSFFIWKASTT